MSMPATGAKAAAGSGEGLGGLGIDPKPRKRRHVATPEHNWHHPKKQPERPKAQLDSHREGSNGPSPPPNLPRLQSAHLRA